MNNLVVLGKQNIEGMEFIGIEGGFGEGKKAMLVKDIARLHGKKEFHINELINNNIKRFKNGIDVINLLSNENFKIVVDDLELKSSNRQKFSYLLSERGYSKLLKIMDDDFAWEQYDKLVDNYFNMRQELQLTLEERFCLDVIKANNTLDKTLAVNNLLSYKNGQIQEKEEEIQELSPLAELAKKRIDSTGTVSLTDLTKTFKLKKGQISTYLRQHGYIHKSQTEVNKRGEKYFKIVGVTGRNIGILEEGIKFIDKNIEEIRKSPTYYRRLNPYKKQHKINA